MNIKFLTGAVVLGLAAVTPSAQESRMPAAADLQRMAARFVPTEIKADLSALSSADRQVLGKLVQASKVMDALFLRQVWSGNEPMLLELARADSPDARARLHYFLINKGPWDRLDHHRPFVAGAPAKPAGANFYPEAAPKAEIERWIQSLPEAPRAAATGFFTVIRRNANGGLVSVPYNVEYQNELAHTGTLLR